MGGDPFLESLRKKGSETNLQFIDQAESMVDALSATSTDLRGLLVPIHTLKGDLGALGYVSIQKLVHEFESIVLALDEAREGTREKWRAAPASFFETAHFCLRDGLSVVRRSLEAVADGRDEDPQDYENHVGEFSLCRSLVDEFNSLATAPEAQAAGSPKKQVQNLVQNPNPVSSQIQRAPAIDRNEMENSSPSVDLVAAAQQKDFFLLCSLNGVDYALPVLNVREVIKRRQVQDLPIARPDLIGLITLRGETLPVCNVTHHLAAATGSDLPLMVICQIGDRKLAIPMQRADKVLEIERSNFRPLQGATTQDTQGPIRHILPEKDKVILLVDVERLVAA